MATDIDIEANAKEGEVDALARELGEAIAALPEHEAFAEAKAAVESDPETQEKIEEFERLREEFMLARQTGDATQSDLREVQRKQEELHSMPVMADYLEAKEELESRLEALNETISDPLAVDFGGEAGGCCHD